MKHKIAFTYMGGKYSHLKFLLPNFPKEKMFVDVFGGSASVCLNVEGYKHIVYNDVNKEIVNFFQVLREEPDALIEKLKLTPYSRDEYLATREDIVCDRVERARRFFVKVDMGFSGNGSNHGGFSTSNNIKAGSKAITFKNKIEGLYDIAEKLRSIVIENLDWEILLDKCDKEKAFIYLDPPYTLDTRTKSIYIKEFSNEDHIKLIERLHSLKGKWALSGYRNDLYDGLLKDYRRIDDKPKSVNSSRGKANSIKQECLWVNY